MSKNTTDLREQITSIVVTVIADGIDAYDETGTFPPLLSNTATDELLALISNREKLARIDELERLIADTLEPEKVGGHFIHKPVKEFVKQLKQWTNEQLATLRKELDGGQS